MAIIAIIDDRMDLFALCHSCIPHRDFVGGAGECAGAPLRLCPAGRLWREEARIQARDELVEAPRGPLLTHAEAILLKHSAPAG